MVYHIKFQEGGVKMYKLQDLLPVALIFVVATIGIAIGADILTSVQDGQVADGVSYNVSGFGLSSLTELGTWLPNSKLAAC
jgi:hypothetical protein